MPTHPGILRSSVPSHSSPSVLPTTLPWFTQVTPCGSVKFELASLVIQHFVSHHSTCTISFTLPYLRLGQGWDSDMIAKSHQVVLFRGNVGLSLCSTEYHRMFCKCYFAGMWNRLDVPKVPSQLGGLLLPIASSIFMIIAVRTLCWLFILGWWPSWGSLARSSWTSPSGYHARAPQVGDRWCMDGGHRHGNSPSGRPHWSGSFQTLMGTNVRTGSQRNLTQTSVAG